MRRGGRPARGRATTLIDRAAAIMAAVAAATAAGGCGDERSKVDRATTSPATATTKAADGRAAAAVVPALCAGVRGRVAGRIGAAAATELSGLVRSRTQPGVLWTHNDSGDRPRVLAIGLDGRLLADVAVSGAASLDWEDIAAAPEELLIGDIGDNLARRATVSVYRVREPRAGAGAPAASAPAVRIELRYDGGPRDAEALLRDPSSGALVVVEKNFAGRPGVYVAVRPAGDGAWTLRRRARLRLGPGEAVTAGDVSADGRTIALRTYDSVFVWARRRGDSVATALRREPCVARRGLLAEGQGEALALSPAGRAFHTVAEGRTPLLRRYAVR